MKQTAVEWLVDNYLPLKRGVELENQNTLKKVNQAKEIFERQIKDAYNQGYRHGEVQECNLENDVANFDDAINYYNETFKNQKNAKI